MTATLTRSQLYQRAQLAALGYGQTEKPARDVMQLVTSGTWIQGRVDLSPVSPTDPRPVGLQVRGFYPPTQEIFDVSDRVNSLTWTEASGTAAVQGTLTLDNTDGTAAKYMNRPGMILMFNTRHSAQVPFVERYRWVAWTTNFTDLVQAAGTISFYDVLIYLQTAELSVGYVQDSAHPKGWTASQIAADILPKYGVPVGSIAHAKHPIPTFILQDTTLYDLLAQAYSIEGHYTGQNFWVVADRGLVYITNNRRALPGSQRFPITDQAIGGNIRQGDFTRTLDQYAGGIIPSGGDANLLLGNQKGAIANYAKYPGGREDRAALSKTGSQSPAEKALAGQLLPIDPLVNPNPGAQVDLTQTPSKNQQRINAQLAAQLLFGAMKVKVSADDIASIDDPTYTALAAQLLADATSSAQKQLHCVIDGNVLLREGDIVYSELTFAAGRPLRKSLYISQLIHSIQNGDYSLDVTMNWRAQDVSVLEDYTEVTQNAKDYAQTLNPNSVGATNTGHGGVGTGVGGWVTIGATEYNDPGKGSFGILQTPGYHYAELGTASVVTGNATGHGNLAKALGLTGELPTGFKVQIKYAGKTCFATKADRGAGQAPYGSDGAGTPFYALDLYMPSGITSYLGFPGKASLQVRPAS